jgi:hypothetical protein
VRSWVLCGRTDDSEWTSRGMGGATYWIGVFQSEHKSVRGSWHFDQRILGGYGPVSQVLQDSALLPECKELWDHALTKWAILF